MLAETAIAPSPPREARHYFPTFLPLSRAPYRRAPLDEFPPGEYPALRECLAGQQIARACAREYAFHRQVAIIRKTPGNREISVAHRLARKYATRGSAGHLVMVHILIAAADWSDTPFNQEVGVVLGAEIIWSDLIRSVALLNCDPATHPGHQRYKPGSATDRAQELGAELISRRGAELCLWPGCDADRQETISTGAVRYGIARSSGKYCEEHFDHSPDEKKRHEKLIERTFAAAASALPRLDEQILALAQFSDSG